MPDRDDWCGGWASDLWGGEFALGGRAVSAALVPWSAEPDVPVDASSLPRVGPGPELARLLAATDPASVSDADVVDVITATERLSRWATAMQIQAIAELSRRPVFFAHRGRDEHDELRSAGGAGAQAAAAMKNSPGETRSIDQLRADALIDMARISLDSGWLGGVAGQLRLATAHGRRPHIQVTVPFSTLIGIDEQPAELEGYGPIPASVARRIAAHGVWRRLLTDPRTGALLDYGTTRYQPPADLREFVIARDRTCAMPVCGQPRPALPNRPHHPLPRRPHRRGQPRPALPTPPQPENPRRLAPGPARTRPIRMDHTRRQNIPTRTRSHRTDHRTVGRRGRPVGRRVDPPSSPCSAA